MFTIEGLTKQIAAYAKQRIDHLKLADHLSGGIQVLEHQIKSLTDEAARVAAEAAAKLAEEEAAKLIDSAVPGAGEAVMDALIGTSTEAATPAQEG